MKKEVWVAAAGLGLALAGLVWAGGALANKVDTESKRNDGQDHRLDGHDKHLGKHDVMLAMLTQAQADAHAAKINTEKLLKAQEADDGE
jgi:hypothetical protein